jgi:hypothetical protein
MDQMNNQAIKKEKADKESLCVVRKAKNLSLDRNLT